MVMVRDRNRYLPNLQGSYSHRVHNTYLLNPGMINNDVFIQKKYLYLFEIYLLKRINTKTSLFYFPVLNKTHIKIFLLTQHF